MAIERSHAPLASHPRFPANAAAILHAPAQALRLNRTSGARGTAPARTTAGSPWRVKRCASAPEQPSMARDPGLQRSAGSRRPRHVGQSHTALCVSHGIMEGHENSGLRQMGSGYLPSATRPGDEEARANRGLCNETAERAECVRRSPKQLRSIAPSSSSASTGER